MNGDVPAPPRYIDEVIDDFLTAPPGEHNHLGHWRNPSSLVGLSRRDAQQAMSDMLIEMAGVKNGSRVVDVGCGFGGTLASLDRGFDGAHLVGLDVDHRQIVHSKKLAPTAGNQLGWVVGDACRLPFASASFDHLISIEAMWHFPSRGDFLAESARILRDGGRMAVVDLLISPNAADELGMSRQRMTSILNQGFAPWPEPEATLEGIQMDAAASGLVCRSTIDATENTTPTYSDAGDTDERPSAAAFSSAESVKLFVRMHMTGVLRVVYLSFERLPRDV